MHCPARSSLVRTVARNEAALNCTEQNVQNVVESPCHRPKWRRGIGHVKKLWTDWIALVTAGVGILLMVLTWMWRVNPVEGSVMPDFLTNNPFGLALTFVLLG